MGFPPPICSLIVAMATAHPFPATRVPRLYFFFSQRRDGRGNSAGSKVVLARERARI